MKTRVVITASLLAIVMLGTGIFVMVRRVRAMEARFSTRDFPEHGVRIITPADQAFDGIATGYFTKNPPRNLKPFSVFIQNSGSRLIVAYSITWELFNEGKKITSSTIGYSEPGVLLGNEIPADIKHTTAIEVGKARCFSWNAQVFPDFDNEEKPDAVRDLLFSQLSKASDVTVSLDGVVFDDGTFIGPNQTGFIDQMEAMVAAKSDLMREVVEAHQTGTVDAAFEAIVRTSQEPDVVFSATVIKDEWYRHFKKSYAKEIVQQRNFQGKNQSVSYLIRSYGRAQRGLRKLKGKAPR